MRRPGGQAEWSGGGQKTVTRDTFSCCHCNAVVFVKPKADPSEMGGFCRLCMKHVCKKCEALGKCVPFERRLEEIERRGKLLEAAGIPK